VRGLTCYCQVFQYPALWHHPLCSFFCNGRVKLPLLSSLFSDVTQSRLVVSCHVSGPTGFPETSVTANLRCVTSQKSESLTPRRKPEITHTSDNLSSRNSNSVSSRPSRDSIVSILRDCCSILISHLGVNRGEYSVSRARSLSSIDISTVCRVCNITHSRKLLHYIHCETIHFRKVTHTYIVLK